MGSRGNESDPFAATASGTIDPGTQVPCTLLVHSADWAYDWKFVFTLVVGLPGGTRRWGPRPCVGMPATPDISGITYNSQDGNIYCTHLLSNNIYAYTADTLLAFRRCLPTPEDSCTDIDYCEYDNTFWLLANKSKRVYKLDATSGAVLRSFSVSAVECPFGLVENRAENRLYLSDRRITSAGQQRIFIYDTQGNFIRAVYHPKSAGKFASRCLALDQGVASNPPSLLSMFVWCDSSGVAFDSCVLYELDRTSFAILNSKKFDTPVWNLRGIEYDARDGSYWLTAPSAGGYDNAVIKVSGFHNPPQVGLEQERPLPNTSRAVLEAKPNPFTRATTISFAPGATASGMLRIYDNNGRLVRELSAAGSVIWDGKNRTGEILSPGIYFCRLAGSSNDWTKLVLSR